MVGKQLRPRPGTTTLLRIWPVATFHRITEESSCAPEARGAIHQALGREYRRCQTPFLVEKEIGTHFLGYTLVRKASCQAALLHEVHPRAVRFTARQQTSNAARSQLPRACQAERVRQGEGLLRELGKQRVGNRPDR
jgi:hypothetical protein